MATYFIVVVVIGRCLLFRNSREEPKELYGAPRCTEAFLAIKKLDQFNFFSVFSFSLHSTPLHSSLLLYIFEASCGEELD